MAKRYLQRFAHLFRKVSLNIHSIYDGRPHPNMSKDFTPARKLILTACFAFSTACSAQDITPPRVKAEALPTPAVLAADIITIAAVGDIMLGSTSINDTFLPPNDGRDSLRAVTSILSAADITFGNLEGPLVDGGTTKKCPPPEPIMPGEEPKPIRCFAFRSPTRYGKYLKEAGFDVLSLANNHAFDFGNEGRLSTRKTLKALGIAHAGSGLGDYAMTIIESKGKKIAFIGFAHNAIVPNVNVLDAAARLVRAAKKKADIIVVSFHGGAEGEGAQNVQRTTEIYVGEKRGNLPLFAKTVIDAGADLVLGHGPHVLRGVEIYKERLIVYSMGNFATYGMFNLKGAQGLTGIFEIGIGPDGRFVSGKIHSGRQSGRGIPELDPTGAAAAKVRALSQTDFPKTSPRIADDGTISVN
jgi:capsule synthesis protein PGA_cap